MSDSIPMCVVYTCLDDHRGCLRGYAFDAEAQPAILTVDGLAEQLQNPLPIDRQTVRWKQVTQARLGFCRPIGWVPLIIRRLGGFGIRALTLVMVVRSRSFFPSVDTMSVAGRRLAVASERREIAVTRWGRHIAVTPERRHIAVTA